MKTCATCEWVEKIGDHGMWCCVRYPPAVVHEPETEDNYGRTLTVWPEVQASDRCGEWTAKEKTA